MNSLMALINTDQKIVAPTKKSDGKETKSNTDDFVSILFKQIKNSIKIPSKADIQIISTNDTNEKYSKKTDKSKTSDEILLGEILNIIDQLKVTDPKTNFPKFSDKMDKILSNESIKNDFKNVKNLDDVLKLSKKYNLKLKNIKFTKEKIDTLKKDFPKLNFKKFFETQNLNDKNLNDKIPTLTKSGASVTIEQLLNTKPNKETTNLPKNILQTLLRGTDKSTKKIMIKSGEEDKKIKVENYINSDKEDKEQKISVAKKNSKKTENTENIIQEKSKNIQQKEPIITNIETKTKKNSKKSNKNSNSAVSSNDIKNDTFGDTIKHGENIKKSTTVNDLKEQKNIVHKDNRENILQAVKQAKEKKVSNTNSIHNKTIDIQQDSDTGSNKDNQNETISHKHEYKTLFQAENHKTSKQVEIKQSLNTFTNDLKDKIEQYKPPIMKVKMALNPKNLGEVEVTLIHRGNNLHVNITSNTNTMSLFTQNQAEFKNSLVNMGFTNLEMNFSDQDRQNQQNQQDNKRNSNSFEDFQNSENLESSLELIVPKYI